jgi:hypothetical protein
MEIFLIVFFLSLVVGGGLYLSDRKGWNATAKRLTTIARANLEAKKPIKALEPVKTFDDWDNQFKALENPQAAVPAIDPARDKNVRHVVVKTDFYDTHLGPWPQWTCKCGQSGYEAVLDHEGAMQESIRDAKRSADAHIKRGIEVDAMKSKSNGAFSW